MSHCVHFLRRLERVSMTHADFALELYRNPELVRMLMSEFSEHYGEERAALALGENGAGPYVVVAVDGGFVTCLGEKMKPRGLKVVRRELLESRRVFNEEFSQAVKRYRKLNREGGTSRLFRRVIGNGQLVCREDVEQILAVLPAVQMNFMDHISAMTRMVLHDRGKLLYVIDLQRQLRRKRGQVKRLTEKVASRHWIGAWSIATCHAVVAAGGEHSLMSMYFTESDELGPLHTVSLVEGHSGLALRSLWGVGMRGRAVVGVYESHLHTFEIVEQVIGNIASLTVAALRYRELRERVQKHLKDIRRAHGGYARVDFALACAYGVLSDDLQPYYDVQLVLGGKVYEEIRRSLSPRHPYYYKNISDVPASLLCTLGVMFPSRFHNSDEAVAGMFACLPWLAQASIGDLFLPRKLNDTLLAVGPTSAERGLELLRSQLNELDNSQPVVNSESAGRNDPCPCESGRKYKQCCLNHTSSSALKLREMLSSF